MEGKGVKAMSLIKALFNVVLTYLNYEMIYS